MIKVKKEGKNLVSMFLRIMKNVISLEDIKTTITEYGEYTKKFMKEIN